VAILVDLAGLRMPDLMDPAALGRRVQVGLLSVMRNYSAAMQSSQVIPADTGALAASIPVTIEATPRQARIGTPLIYGLVMEKGRRPGQRRPPIDAILPWVRRKLRPKPEPLKTKRKAKLKGWARRANRLAAAERSVAFLVARKIGDQGIKIPLVADGRGGMFRRTLDREIGSVPRWFREGYEAAR